MNAFFEVDIFCSGHLSASCCQEGRFVICALVWKKTNSSFDQGGFTRQPWTQHVPLALLCKVDYCMTLSSWREWMSEAIWFKTVVQFDYLLFLHTKRMRRFAGFVLVLRWEIRYCMDHCIRIKCCINQYMYNSGIQFYLIHLYFIFSGYRHVKIYCRNKYNNPHLI